MEFSNDEKLLAFIDSTEKLKIWDTETNVLKQEYTANMALMASCTCLKWIDFKESNKSPKKAKLSTIFLALGTAKGGVALYSYSSAQIEKNFTGKGHQGAVTSITYNGVNSLFTCGKDCKVIEWNVTTGAEGKTYKIGNEIPAALSVLNQSKQLLTGSKHLKLWNLTNGELIHTFTGHQTKVNRLQPFAYGGKQFIVSSAENNRFPALWCLDGNQDKKTESSVATFAVDDAARFLNVKMIENTMNLCVVTVSGALHYFKVDMENAQSKKPVKPKLVMRIVADSTEVVESINILAATIQSAGSIKVAYGEMNLLQSETITPDFTKKEQILLRANPSKVVSNQKQKNVNETTKTVQGHVDAKSVEFMSFATAIKRKPLEIPMETRLENLTIGAVKNRPHAKQLVKLLIQGLHSKDAKILKLVFQQQEEEIVALTLTQLPPQYVGTLVNELSIWMQKKGVHVNESLIWLKILVQTHASQLMALGEDEIMSSFGVCLGIIEHKVECLKSLSKLRGRLDLLINLVDRSAEEDQIQNNNTLVYEDHSSESEIEQDESAPDDNWESDEEMEVSE